MVVVIVVVGVVVGIVVVIAVVVAWMDWIVVPLQMNLPIEKLAFEF